MPDARTPGEESPQATIALLRATLDAVPGWLALVDRDGTYLVANRKYADAFGRPLDRIEGRRWQEVFPELAPVHGPLLDRCLAGETVSFDDVLLLDPEHPTAVHGVYRPIPGPDGAVRFISVIVMDVTRQVTALEALRCSEERFREVFSALPVALEVRDGRTLEARYVNPAYEALSGLSGAEIPAAPADFLQRVHPDDREALARSIQEQSRGPEPRHYEFRLLRGDGDVRWVWSAAVPVPDDAGGIRWWVTTLEDITQRRVAQEALRESEERLAAEKERLAVTLASIADGVITADIEGRVVLMNEVAERLTGRVLAEAVGRPLLEVLRMADRGWRAASEEGFGLHGRRVLASRDGKVLPVEHRSTPLRDPEGRILGEVVVVRDISESLRREEERIQAQKLESLAVLAGGIAHDFNNLLTGIQGNLSLALAGRDLPEDVRGWLADAVAAGERSQGLTQQLLTFARGGAPVRKVSDLSRAVQQAATFAGLGSSVACRVRTAPDLWPAEADVGQIGQVVQNLVLNAVEATPGPGEVEVACDNRFLEPGNDVHLPPGPYLLLRVEDHGAGIPDDVRPRIFDPYFSTKQRRSGLGLAISHSIVVRHGGRILVDSAPGRGTTFDVYLPALPAGQVPGTVAGRALAGRGGTALVMDDDPFVRRVAQRALMHLGWTVACAGDGGEAVESYRRALATGAPFDVVLMDLTIPGGMGGVEAMAALRSLDPGVRAIVMSGYSDNPVLSAHAQYGFAAVLPKPFTLERLEEALAQARGVAGGPDPAG